MLIEIFGENIKNEMDFHRQFNSYVKCSYYGHNLVALWDILGDEDIFERPSHLIWHNYKNSKILLGTTFQRIIEIFDEAYEYVYRLDPQDCKTDEKFTYELR